MLDFSGFKNALDTATFPIPFPGHWIEKTWKTTIATKATPPSINPNDGKTMVQCSSDKQCLLDALNCAEANGEKLRFRSFEQRLETVAALRRAMADYQTSFLSCLKIESGKPQWDAAREFDASIKFLDSVLKDPESTRQKSFGPLAGASGSVQISSQPIGAIVAYLPFSTPVLSFVQYFAAAHLTGCPLIVCPSLHASLCGFLIGYIAESMDLPNGCISVVFGTFENFQSVIGDRRIQGIIYTGSREHCELIRRESRSNLSRQLILQSGGKNSVLVHSSADIGVAVETVMTSAFVSCGQLCSSASRVFVHKTLLNDFVSAFLEKASNMKIGRTDTSANKGEEDVFMGPLYSQKAVEKFLRYQTMAHRDAQRDILWGKNLEITKDGCFVSPGVHLMKKFDRSSAFQSNVLFCPDVTIFEYDVLDQAIDQVNATDAPYAISFVGDKDIAIDRLTQFSAPNILINKPTTSCELDPLVGGKLNCGHYRFTGSGLSMLLSYPQAVYI